MCLYLMHLCTKLLGFLSQVWQAGVKQTNKQGTGLISFNWLNVPPAVQSVEIPSGYNM